MSPALRLLPFAVAIALFASACAGGPRARPEGANLNEPSTSAASSALRTELHRFVARSTGHRTAAAASASELDGQLQNWNALLERLELFDAADDLARTGRDDLLRARVVLADELARDFAVWPAFPAPVADRIYDRIGRLALLLATLEQPGPARTGAGLQVVPARATAAGSTAGFDQLEWPLQPVIITSAFGERLHPVHGGRTAHRGLDLLAEPGQPVNAAKAGRVRAAGWNGALGLHVEVDHGGGLRTRYAHLSRLLVATGTDVVGGQALGLAGDTGETTGVHLHFEVWRGDAPVDPLRELPPVDQARQEPAYSSRIPSSGQLSFGRASGGGLTSL